MKYYMECLDCDTVIDYWKYDSVDDTDHRGCKLRELTKEETISEANECFDDECLTQEHMGQAEKQRQELLKLIGKQGAKTT